MGTRRNGRKRGKANGLLIQVEGGYGTILLRASVSEYHDIIIEQREPWNSSVEREYWKTVQGVRRPLWGGYTRGAGQLRPTVLGSLEALAIES